MTKKTKGHETAAAPATAAGATPKAVVAGVAGVTGVTGVAGVTVVIRQIKSGICAPADQKQTLRAMGLRRIRHEVTRPDTPTLRGQIRKVRHLVAVVGA